MRLKDRKTSPVGGFWYDDPITDKVIATQGDFNKLVSEVKSWHSAQGVKSPPEIEQIIENQICDRQPKNKCFNKGLGDIIASAVQIVAGAVDAVAGTNLKKKAKRCGGCSKRRVMLNS